MTLDKLIIKANKNLFRNRIRNLLNILAIIISSMSLAMILYAANGTKKMAESSYSQYEESTRRIQIVPKESGPNISHKIEGVEVYRDYDVPSKNELLSDFFENSFSMQDVEKLDKIEGVEKAYPQYSVRLEYVQDKGKKYYSSFNLVETENPKTLFNISTYAEQS